LGWALTILGCAPGSGDASGSNSSPSTSEASETAASSAPVTTTDAGTTTSDVSGSSGGTGDPTTGSSGPASTGAEASTGGPDEESTGATTGAPAQLPGDVIDLTNWKLTLPIAGDDPDKPLEILQPELATYVIDPWYVLGDDAMSVRFRANAGGVTTSNSGYPRSELREMTDGGAELAAWSTTEGVHTMTITQAITHLPEVKPHVVAGQIHDDADDVVMIRLEGSYLFVEGGGDDLGVLDPDYQLGAPFTVRLRAAAGVIDVYYQDLDSPAVSVARDAVGCYFKAGVYTQSNVEKGDAPDAYGEVVVQDLVVTHE
jgi:poly(beta-D-mannuronate) lyase